MKLKDKISRVCHITTVHQSDDVRIFHKECKSLSRAGYDVTLLVANTDTIEQDKLKVIGVEVLYNTRLGRIIKAPKQLYKKALEIDAEIYHFHDPEFLPYALRLKDKGKKVIYDVHEDLPRQILHKKWIPALFRRFLAILFEFYENHAAKKLDYVVSATPFIRDRFLKVNQKSIDINNYPLMSEMKETLSDLKVKKNQICYLGSISEIRGITQLVNALEILEDDIRLVLAGPYSQESYKITLKQLAGWKKVVDMGVVGRGKVFDLMEESIAGMVTFLPVPNHVYSQPNKLFEYMSAGLPIIASNFPLWKKIVEGYKCGICVNPENAEDIADAIEYIQSNPVRAKEMGVAGRKAVQNHFNWNFEEAKLLQVYKSLQIN